MIFLLGVGETTESLPDKTNGGLSCLQNKEV